MLHINKQPVCTPHAARLLCCCAILWARWLRLLQLSAVWPCSCALQDEVIAEVAGQSWGSFKPLLTDAVVDHLRPVQAK